MTQDVSRRSLLALGAGLGASLGASAMLGGSALAWLFVVVRTLGSSLVVPPLEEVFFRSFLYRYLITPEFE